MYNNVNRISTATKFNPEDERIFCPNVSKEGVTGHGLLKKYYIPHLGVNICEYCEIEEDGERRNLSYYQSRKLSKHLISELQNWREEILKFQNINNEVNVKNIVYTLQENNKHLDASEMSLSKCKEEVTSLKSLVEGKLLAYFSYLEEILLIKDLIDECKFDANGKLNLVGIGTDSSREAKYIWMSLLFSNMKRQHLNPENFGLTEEVQRSIEKFVNLYVSLNSDCNGFVRNLCYNLLPEIARLENKQITIDCDDLVRRMPTTNTGVDISIVNQLRARIEELEIVNSQKDSFILELRDTIGSLNQREKGHLEEIDHLKLKIEDLLKLSRQRDPEISNMNIVINQINEENNRNKLRIAELENIITEERKDSDLKMSELNLTIEKLRSDYREVKISHENLFLGTKELEALLLAERERAEGYKQTIQDLQAKYAELILVRDNLILELHSKNQNIANSALLEKEIEKLRKALADKDNQYAEFNSKYYQMLSDYDYLKQSNESLKTQIEGHITNYNLLTGINHGLAKRQAVMGEPNIVSTSIKNLPIVEVETKAPVKVENLNKSDYETFELVSSGAPQLRTEAPKSFFESKIFVANDAPVVRPNYMQNSVFIPNATTISTTSVQFTTPKKEETASIPNEFRRSTYLAPYEIQKYPKEIDFITVNPKNLLLSYSNLHRIGDWINSQNTLYNIFKVNILYKASYEDFSAEKFKALCSGIPEIVVLALTSTGKVIGGYTPLAWQSGKNSEETDSSKKTFIFSLDEGRMFPLKLGEVAIINKDNYGPIFGRNDLEFLDGCNSVESAANPEFGSSFDTSGVSAEQFFGGPSYTIKEYEVYQIYPSTF